MIGSITWCGESANQSRSRRGGAIARARDQGDRRVADGFAYTPRLSWTLSLSAPSRERIPNGERLIVPLATIAQS
jgi:hypothetical protein